MKVWVVQGRAVPTLKNGSLCEDQETLGWVNVIDVGKEMYVPSVFSASHLYVQNKSPKSNSEPIPSLTKEEYPLWNIRVLGLSFLCDKVTYWRDFFHISKYFFFLQDCASLDASMNIVLSECSETVSFLWEPLLQWPVCHASSVLPFPLLSCFFAFLLHQKSHSWRS